MSDLISRQAAIDALMEWEETSVWDDGCLKHRGEPHWLAPSDVIERLPSAQPERKKGLWEMKPDPYGFFDEIPVCSECGCTTKLREVYKFCPNCGADMREE